MHKTILGLVLMMALSISTNAQLKEIEPFYIYGLKYFGEKQVGYVKGRIEFDNKVGRFYITLTDIVTKDTVTTKAKYWKIAFYSHKFDVRMRDDRITFIGYPAKQLYALINNKDFRIELTNEFNAKYLFIVKK